MSDNVINLNMTDGRHEEWKFPDGTVVRMDVPDNESPITIAHSVYCFSSILHGIHAAMFTSK